MKHFSILFVLLDSFISVVHLIEDVTIPDANLAAVCARNTLA